MSLIRSMVLVAVCAATVLVAGAPAATKPFPASIPLPVDFWPEGIAVGTGSTFYAGSLRTGDIYRGDLRRARAVSSSTRRRDGPPSA